jgi:hypothetical protein
VACNNLEITPGNAQTMVGLIGGAADYLARPAGCVAQEILVLLFERLARVITHADKELIDPRISEQAIREVIDDRGNGIVAAQTIVKRFLVGSIYVGH